MELTSAGMAGKTTDPNYKQISGHVPKDLLLAFRKMILEQESTVSVALEQAIVLWMGAVDAGKKLPEAKERIDQRFKDSGE